MDVSEYLVSHGNAGGFGRFRPAQPMTCRRGDRVVVRSERGLELGEVMCPATPRHLHFLQGTFVGELLRRAAEPDERQAEQMRDLGVRLFEDSCRLSASLNLPLEFLDAEVLLDGQRATLYFLRWADCDERDLVSGLSRKFEIKLELHDLALPKEARPAENEHGCGRPDCGRGSGGCSTCGSGGCSTGGCGSVKPQDLKAYFAGLRAQMEERRRTALL